jgi:VanZ family protein
MTLRRFWWAFGFVLVAIATYFCLIPGAEVPKEFEVSDIVSHFVGHGTLALYFAGLVPMRRWWKIFVFLLAFGIIVELAQFYMNWGREGEVKDVFSNAAGALLGLLVAWLGLHRWPEWAARLLGRQAV